MYTQRGYEEICTGGNCTGFYRKFPDSGTHILITDGDNAAPKDLNAPVCAGLYAENGTWLATMDAKDSAELFRKITAGEWQYAE